MEPKAISHHLNNVCEEFLDGYILIGFAAQSGHPIIQIIAKDSKTGLALQQLLHGVLSGQIIPNTGEET